MIKYFREKIIGRPVIATSSDGSPSCDDHQSSSPPMANTHLHSSLDDLIANDRTIHQMEKSINAGNTITSGRRPISTSSPITIPKKPPRSNASSQSSSSYTSIVDQMSSLGESLTLTRRDPDDATQMTLPTLPSASQQLEHTAARDRISVKNKRRQPTKQRLSTLRETDDNEVNLFPKTTTEVISSTPEEEQPPITVVTRAEPKVQQPLIDLSDLHTTRARLRMSVRARDRSADNILLPIITDTNATPEPSGISAIIGPKLTNPMQRSISFKRPQEMSDKKCINRPILPLKLNDKTKDDPVHTDRDDMSEPTIENDSIAKRSSSQEHIYDNLDVFKRSKATVIPLLTEDLRSEAKTSTRSRPVSMHVATGEEMQSTNEFENIFNQLKKRGSIRRVRPQEAILPAPPGETPAPSKPLADNEPPAAVTMKPAEMRSIPPSPSRRKTLAGVDLSANNKVGTDEPKPAPSWVDIAKQKQSKFQTVSNEKECHDEMKGQPSMESPVAVRKQVSSADMRSNRKSMFESSSNQANTAPSERDSIRAMKTGNPNRINNLIQFFDK